MLLRRSEWLRLQACSLYTDRVSQSRNHRIYRDRFVCLVRVKIGPVSQWGAGNGTMNAHRLELILVQYRSSGVALLCWCPVMDAAIIDRRRARPAETDNGSDKQKPPPG